MLGQPPPSRVEFGWKEWRQGRGGIFSPFRIPHISMIDGEPTPWYGGSAPGLLKPGVHTFLVEVRWSNDWQDQTELTFEAESGKMYVILTYELAPDEPEEQAEVRRYKATEQLAQIVLPPLLVGPVLAGAAGYVVYRGARKLVGEETKEQATSRPFDRCCFVWVQEEASGRVVAGERPGGEPRHVPEVPNKEDD